jgi:nucleoside-triphosphatase
MKSPKIYILTGDIQTGKSDALMNWIDETKSVSGFITPSVKGVKMLYDIQDQKYDVYEMVEGNSNSISVGKYHLNGNAFKLAENIYQKAIQTNTNYFIMDEIGKLELNKQGHSLLLKHVLSTWKSSLLLVVRTSLIDQVITCYKIDQYSLLTKDILNELSL